MFYNITNPTERTDYLIIPKGEVIHHSFNGSKETVCDSRWRLYVGCTKEAAEYAVENGPIRLCKKCFPSGKLW
jgi:hypothetical protein